MAVNIEVNDIAVSGRLTSGVKGINLTGKDVVVSSILVESNDLISIISSNSFGKLVKINEFEISQRNRKGLKCMSYKGMAECLGAFVANDKLNYVLEGEKLIYVQNKSLKLANRTNAGLTLTTSKTGTKIKNVYRYTLI